MKAWLRDIERARSGAEVVASARDYVSLWSPRELPEGCREIRIEDEADIARLRERLASGSPEPLAPRPCADRLHELVAYLTRASERLGELREP
jgi:hypothetical protein